MSSLQLPRPCQEKNVSLSMMAEVCLGKPLDKQCQVSRWGRRPLSERQLQYAALDALVSLLVYEHLEERHGPSIQVHIKRILHSISTASSRQTDADRRKHPVAGPDQRLPQPQPESYSSASKEKLMAADKQGHQLAQTSGSSQQAGSAAGEGPSQSSIFQIINSNSQAVRKDRGKLDGDQHGSSSGSTTQVQGTGNAAQLGVCSDGCAAAEGAISTGALQVQSGRPQQHAKHFCSISVPGPQKQKRPYLPLRAQQGWSGEL